MQVLLRVVLTLLVVAAGLVAGIKLGPRSSFLGPRSPVSPARAAQPDWGGGLLSVSDHSAAGVIDSVRMASGGDRSRTQTFSGRTGGVLLQHKSGSDYSLTMAITSPGKISGTALFEVPSTARFRKELLPGDGDAEAPATDIPLYPQSSCRMQVGQGTACFIGFYLTPDSVEAVRSFYVRALSRLGWQRVTEDGGRRTEDGGLRMEDVPHSSSLVPHSSLLGPQSSVSGQSALETFETRNEDRTVVVQLRKQDSVTTRIGLVAMASGAGTRSELSDNSVMSPQSERK
jgi:hypothetical protein